MDSRAFLGLESSHNPFRWHLPVSNGVSTSVGNMFGGCGLAAGILALEGTSGRQCVWATAQYLSFARTGEVLDIDVTLAAEGHQMTQGRAICHVGNREVLTVNAALGHRPGERDGQFVAMPDVPPAAGVDRRWTRAAVKGSIIDRFDERLVEGRWGDELDGTPGDGRSVIWARLDGVEGGVDAASLAVLGDFVPMGVMQALGVVAEGTSLDNTLRVGHLVPTGWVLLEIRVHAVAGGVGHGLVHMFAEDGTLLATGSQSCIVRGSSQPATTDSTVTTMVHR